MYEERFCVVDAPLNCRIDPQPLLLSVVSFLPSELSIGLGKVWLSGARNCPPALQAARVTLYYPNA